MAISVIGAITGAVTKALTDATKKQKTTSSKSSSSTSNTSKSINEHEDYINQNYAGGMDAYLKTQQDKMNQAYASGDQDMINRLNADASRVGYSLSMPASNTPKLNLPEYKPYSGKLPKLNLPEYEPFSYKDFSYDYNNDDIYKQYAEQFARQGQSASEKALANTAAATGGMTSSYAAAANAQAQQAYAKKTADMIPVLEENAYNRYSNERNFSYQDYLNQYNSDVQNAQVSYDAAWRNVDFNYQDYLNQYNYNTQRAQALYDADWDSRQYTDSRNDLAYDRSKADEQFNYQKYLDQIDNAYRQSTFDWQKQTDTRDFDYKASQDAIQNALSQSSNSRAWAQFNYNQTQDALNRQLQQEQMNYERNLANMQANYPSSVMGQLEAKTQQAQTAEKENNLRAIVSSALQASDPATWLRENAAYLTDEEYATVVKVLKDYGVIAKKQGE